MKSYVQKLFKIYKLATTCFLFKLYLENWSLQSLRPLNDVFAIIRWRFWANDLKFFFQIPFVNPDHILKKNVKKVQKWDLKMLLEQSLEEQSFRSMLHLCAYKKLDL